MSKSSNGIWYGVGLVVIVLCIAFARHSTSPTPVLAAQKVATSTSTFTISSSVPAAVQRISQLDPGEYRSPQEFATWSPSACSSTSLTEVINSYGHHYRITDILAKEIQAHAITADLGLLDENGIARTATLFGFQTDSGHTRTIDQVIDLANTGHPMIVSFPPQAAWPTGHILVVTGGNASTVFIADSSSYDFTSLSREKFQTWWGGFSALVVPAKGGQA